LLSLLRGGRLLKRERRLDKYSCDIIMEFIFVFPRTIENHIPIMMVIVIYWPKQPTLYLFMLLIKPQTLWNYFSKEILKLHQVLKKIMPSLLPTFERACFKHLYLIKRWHNPLVPIPGFHDCVNLWCWKECWVGWSLNVIQRF
jgi:hypothetical protein